MTSSPSSSSPGAGGVGRRFFAKSAVAAGASLLLTAGVGGAAAAQARVRAAGVVPRLPAPTGPHRLGTTTLHLIDRSRRDPWDHGIPVRELMITLFYPAAHTVLSVPSAHGRYPVARQMTEDAVTSFREIDTRIHHLPAAGVDWAATATHARTGAPAQAVRRPVLLYSPGGGDPRTLGTGLAEELASHGYVVVTVDHPGDAGEVDFPSRTRYRGKVRETVFRGDPRNDPRLFRTAIDTRIADVRFLLDQLPALAAGRNPDAEGRPLPEHLDRAIDPRRVGVYGHSAGGTTAAETLYEDRRVTAAVNLEGHLSHAPAGPGRPGPLFPVAEHGTDRPLLLLGTDGFCDAEYERSWSAVLAHSRGHVLRRRLDGATHWVFTDYAAIAPQLQDAGLMAAADRLALVGAIDPARSVPAVRGHVRSFFRRHLPPR
ncbi:alpha/beta hydrolase [Streptomyces sp. NPDC049577]|uniref:alpha/beta hydrolase family protein n=1 Tax=Streptomyces sp. NPDC049577 TaxID=3155153 RepID=UPI0034175692